MTRKQVALIIAVNAVISAVISVAAHFCPADRRGCHRHADSFTTGCRGDAHP
jgi:hypothetical protein